MPIVFIVGTAGSGKSLLTSSLAEWLRTGKQDVSVVNLDPGAVTLPYSPDVDVRNHVNYEEVMEKYRLGPNGALVLAADLIADSIEEISREVEELQSDMVLVDTSGQMELFAFRASGPYIASELSKEPKAVLYLFDSVFCADPMNYVSSMFLSAAVYNRFMLPQVHLLTKVDLLLKAEVNRIIDWSTGTGALEESIEEKLKGSKRLLSINMMQAIRKLGLKFMLLPVSAKSNKGIINVNTALERILSSGEKYTS